MTALTADRNTPTCAGDLIVLPVHSATTIYAGSLVVIVNDEGTAVPGGTLLGESVFFLAGVATETVVNPAGGTKTVTVRRRGVFPFASTLTAEAVGQLAGTLDDQTVNLYANLPGQTLIGPVVAADGTQAWVDLVPALSALVRLP